jgi:hypothetical protein
MKRLVWFMAVAAFALVAASNALADPRISATATVNSDRMVTFNWNVPAGSYGGAVIVNPTATTDSTGALPYAFGTTIDFHTVGAGTTTYFSGVPLDMTITQPTTVYVQVQLIDPFGDGSCTQGDFQTDCDSQVIPLTIQPICTQVLVTAGYYKTVVVTQAYYTKKLAKRAHWLLRNRHKVKWGTRYHRPKYIKRRGYVWVKARYTRVFHPQVTQQVWVPPVYDTQCH